MSKEKQIEEMCNIAHKAVSQYCGSRYCPCDRCSFKDEPITCDECAISHELYNAGYRKQSEVIDEFAKRLIENLDISVCGFSSEEVTYDVELTIYSLVEEMKGGEE